MVLRLSKLPNTGLAHYRTRRYKEERRCSDTWRRLNACKDQSKNLLYQLLQVNTRERNELDIPTDKHELSAWTKVVAATLMQWLGSSIGQNFLRDCNFHYVEWRRIEPRKKLALPTGIYWVHYCQNVEVDEDSYDGFIKLRWLGNSGGWVDDRTDEVFPGTVTHYTLQNLHDQVTTWLWLP